MTGIYRHQHCSQVRIFCGECSATNFLHSARLITRLNAESPPPTSKMQCNPPPWLYADHTQLPRFLLHRERKICKNASLHLKNYTRLSAAQHQRTTDRD